MMTHTGSESAMWPERDAGDSTADTASGPGPDLAARMAALEARAPGGGDPPPLTRASRRGRFDIPVALAAFLVLALVATMGGAVVAAVSQLVRGYPGIENPDQPLEGARMECMSPPEAAAFLAAHGYRDVVWQVEAGDPNGPNGAKGATTSVQQATPPEHGYVVPGAILGDGKLHMIVDQRVGASGVGACFGMPMP